MRTLMILGWLTTGAWTAATIRVATSPDADLTPTALVITTILLLVTLEVTRRYDKDKDR